MVRYKTSIITIVISGLWLSSAIGQEDTSLLFGQDSKKSAGLDAEKQNVTLFLDDSKVFVPLLPALDGDVLFHAIINSYFSLFNTLPSVKALYKNQVHAFNIFSGMESEIRMSTTASSPVRTPSYRPHILRAHYYNFKRIIADGAEPERKTPFRAFVIDASFTHYSNGQENSTTVSSGDTLTGINTVNGNFSTTYVQGGLCFGWFRPDSATGKVLRAHRIQLYTKPYQFKDHNRIKIIGAIPDSLLAVYNPEWESKFFYSFETQLNGCWFNYFKGSVAVTYFPLMKRYNEFIDPLPVNLTGDVSFTPPLENCFVDFYARYEWGQDLYNINFNERINRFSIGVCTRFPLNLNFSEAENGNSSKNR
jgi:hypothetical protein